MTDELISRQAAIEIIQSMYPGMPRVPWRIKNWKKQYEPYIRLEKEIKELPSAQPERKKGKWIECEDDTSFVKQLPRRWIECSECGASYDPGYKSRYLFCPRCGAEMVKGS